jgi:energy-coupling factor transporter transmembrane protein EcfT
MEGWFKEWASCCVNSEGKSVDCSASKAAVTIDCFKIVFVNLVSALILFTGLIALVMFIVGGYKFMNSSGDPKKLESAKHNFTYGLLGLSVVLLSFLIIKIIATVTGVPCITTFGFGC